MYNWESLSHYLHLLEGLTIGNFDKMLCPSFIFVHIHVAADIFHGGEVSC